jgi:hypothetical protein
VARFYKSRTLDLQSKVGGLLPLEELLLKLSTPRIKHRIRIFVRKHFYLKNYVRRSSTFYHLNIFLRATVKELEWYTN